MSKKSSLANYDSVKVIINSLLLTYKNGLPLRIFEKLYEEHILEKIPYKELGYCDLEQFFCSMPDAVDASYSRDGIMILRAKCDSSNSHLKSLIDQQKSTKPISKKRNQFSSRNQRLWLSQSSRSQCFKPPRKHVPEWNDDESNKNRPFPPEIKNRLCILISKYSSGLDSDELLKAYYHEYKDIAFQSDLSYKDYGFTSCEELLSSLLDIFAVKKFQSKLLFHPIKSSTNQVIQNESKELDSNKVKDENFTSVSIWDFISHIDGVSHDPVSIGEVYSPYNFTIMFNVSALDKLMEEIQDFYIEEILRSWKLGNEHIVINHPVVVSFEGAYTRAVITALHGLDKVEVLYIDYGTTGVVSKSELLYLHKKFFILPSQGISAELYGIEPTTGNYWENCKEISERFLHLVEGKETLFAHVVKTEPHTKKLIVRIINTEDEDDVCINDILVSEGFAQSTDLKKPCIETTNKQNLGLPDKESDESEESFRKYDSHIDDNKIVQDGRNEAHNSPFNGNLQGSIKDGLSDVNKRNSFNNCNESALNKDAINERISCVNTWLQHLPHSSSISSAPVSPEDGLVDVIMHIDAASQGIYDIRCKLLSWLREDVDRDADVHALIMLNTCARALKHVRRILDEVEK